MVSEFYRRPDQMKQKLTPQQEVLRAAKEATVEVQRKYNMDVDVLMKAAKDVQSSVMRNKAADTKTLSRLVIEQFKKALEASGIKDSAPSQYFEDALGEHLPA